MVETQLREMMVLDVALFHSLGSLTSTKSTLMNRLLEHKIGNYLPTSADDQESGLWGVDATGLPISLH